MLPTFWTFGPAPCLPSNAGHANWTPPRRSLLMRLHTVRHIAHDFWTMADLARLPSNLGAYRRWTPPQHHCSCPAVRHVAHILRPSASFTADPAVQGHRENTEPHPDITAHALHAVQAYCPPLLRRLAARLADPVVNAGAHDNTHTSGTSLLKLCIPYSILPTAWPPRASHLLIICGSTRKVRRRSSCKSFFPSAPLQRVL
jgi:hypothetical protein